MMAHYIYPFLSFPVGTCIPGRCSSRSNFELRVFAADSCSSGRLVSFFESIHSLTDLKARLSRAAWLALTARVLTFCSLILRRARI